MVQQSIRPIVFIYSELRLRGATVLFQISANSALRRAIEATGHKFFASCVSCIQVEMLQLVRPGQEMRIQ